MFELKLKIAIQAILAEKSFMNTKTQKKGMSQPETVLLFNESVSHFSFEHGRDMSKLPRDTS